MKNHDEKELSETWDKEAENYSSQAEKDPDYIAYFETIKAQIGNPAGKKVIDVGSGTGMASAYLAEKGAKVYLVDISETALNFGKKYFANKGLKVRCYKQNAFKMKFAPESFDVVWNGGVIEHFNDEEKIKMMKAMWKLVKPGGKLIITAPNAWDLPFMAAKQILLWRKKWAFGREDDLTIERFKELANKAGIRNYFVFAYNPVVGWWFFPYGREITSMLGLNKTSLHKMKLSAGHNIVFVATKA